MPTSLDSAGIRALDASLRRQSFFSAQTLLTDLLQSYKDKIASIINPVTVQRADRVTEQNPEGNVTTGINPTYARAGIKQLLRDMDYQPEPDEAGTIKDLSSNQRIILVLRTNTEIARGAGSFIQQNNADVLDGFPALELYRLKGRVKVRDWEERWQAAADESGDTDADVWWR